jgi:hypothetical protein
MGVYGGKRSLAMNVAGALKRALVTLLVLGLLAAVLFLLSELNARTYRCSIEDGKLVINKGLLLPTGSAPYRPADPALAEAYAPLDLHGHSPGALGSASFSERDELDRALFGLMEDIARPLVTSASTSDLEAGLSMLRRMEKLPGLTYDQRERLKGLQEEVAYYQARVLLDDARKDIAAALAQLRLASDGGSHASSAHQMLSLVEAPAQTLEQALRAAVQTQTQASQPPPAHKEAQP